MSWQAYVDQLVGPSYAPNMHLAAIVGLDGNVWACSPQLQITQSEALGICNGFKVGWEKAQQSGILLGGHKYRFLQGDEQQLQCKQGTSGFSVAKAVQCFVLGIYTEGQQPGNCRNMVEKISNYLQQNGY